MPNGGESSEQKIWDTIRAVERDIHNLAKDGCGHKIWHEAVSKDIRMDLTKERDDRERMGEYILKEMKEMKECIFSDNRTVRNQMLIGMLVLMALALVVDRIMK